MVTVIIKTRNDEVRLARALAALVPAATEGVVRDVIVIDHGSSDGTLVVAEAAGCVVIDAESPDSDTLRRAAGEARGDWLLFLSPSATMKPGWQNEARAFIDLGSGRREATLVRGRFASGWRSWFVSLLGLGQGRLIAKSAYLATFSSPASSASSVSGARRGAA